MAQSKVQVKEVLHYPRLDTVMMVEKTIRGAPEYLTKHGLMRALPKQVQYQTLSYIVDYLVDIGKIIIDERDNTIVWVWNPKLHNMILKNPELIVRSSEK